MQILDANVILRYLLRDNPQMAEQARDAILNGASTTVEVLAEVVYVLTGVYHADRQQAGDALAALLGELYVPNKLSLLYAAKLYKASRLDFVDCVLAGYHHVEGQAVFTFDKKLNKALALDPLRGDS